MAADSINILDLSAATDSKITHISLYSSRAEVTRTCTFKIKPGVNKVKLNGLSNDLDTNSLRYVTFKSYPSAPVFKMHVELRVVA